MTAPTPTDNPGQWQLGRDHERTLHGIEAPHGVLLVESTVKRGTGDALSIKNAEEARNVITFLRMAFGMDRE